MPDLRIPYLPTFGAVGATLEQLAPQIAVQYAHVAWEMINNATSRVKTQAILAGPTLRLAEALAGEDATRARSKPQDPGRGDEEPQTWGSLSSPAGDIVFDLMSAPTGLECQEGVVYARHAVIGGKPRLQYTGAELQEISLPLSWHSLVVPDIEARMQRLVGAMRDREILELVIGSNTAGSVYAGRYVIQRIPHTVEKHNPDGSMLAVQLTVELLEWVDDPHLVLVPAGPAVNSGKTAPATAAKAKGGR